MRFAGIFILSAIVCSEAYADAKLPIVNIGAGSISARSAFGLSSVYGTEKSDISLSSDLYGAEPVEEEIVSVSPLEIYDTDLSASLDLNTNDVLAPNKPRGDLWASNSVRPTSFHIPVSKEFESLASDYKLPEESLEDKIIENEVETIKVSRKKLDNEIAKLVNLQRKADESVRPSKINSYDLKSVNDFAEKKEVKTMARMPVKESLFKTEIKQDKIAVNKVVIPMKSDVIVRKVKPAIKTTNKFKSESDFSKLSPAALKMAFKKTYLSDNKHLSTYKIDDRFDVASDVSVDVEGFTAQRDLSESGGVRPLEVKIGFRNDDSALSRDNYNLLSEYASIVVSNPKRAIQVSIPQKVTLSLDGRKMTARRLAIVEQVLRDSGISDTRIMPVLSQRTDDNFVLRVISSDQYETLSQQKKDMFGDSVSNKTYKSLSW